MILKPPLGSLPNPGHPLAKGLVGCWLMNEGSGNIVQDLSGNGNIGTLVNDAHFIAGNNGPALDFDGTGDYVSFGNKGNNFNTDKQTIVFWMKSNDVTGIVRIYASDSENYFPYTILSYNNRLFFSDENDDYSLETTPTFATGIWYHIVVVFNTSQATSDIYINGVLETTVITSQGWGFATSTNLGSRSGTANYYTGVIDGFSIYKRCLTASEIAQLYREPFAMFERDPIELWTAASPEAVVGGVIGQIYRRTIMQGA